MKTWPLPALSLDLAIERQFAFVSAITRHFGGAEFLAAGDMGLVPGIGRPVATAKAEAVLADFFEQEDAVLVRGAGTGAIRSALFSAFGPGSRIFVHSAPVYPTTKTSFEMMNITPVEADFNDHAAAVLSYQHSSAAGALIQLARQKPDDSWDYAALIPALKRAMPERPVISDDNYAVMKVPRTGCQCGADLSCFSMFKLLGPEGIGCVTGKRTFTEKIRSTHYSGGVQVQGCEAMEALRSIVYAPVAFAIQAKVCDEVVKRILCGEVKGVSDAFVVNAQSRVVIIELDEGLDAAAVIGKAGQFGATPYPVGSESRYEVAPLFYRVSGTFLKSDPSLSSRLIRINPMRAGADTVLDILRRSLENVNYVPPASAKIKPPSD